jgi:hypothetical protein
MNIVFTFLCAVLHNCHHPLGFLKGEEVLDYWSSHNHVRKKSSPWRLLSVLCSAKCLKYVCPVSCEKRVNHDMFGGVTGLHGFCGR